MQQKTTPANWSPAQLRQHIREGQWHKPTAGCCAGYLQVNVVILPQALADSFSLFCHKNPRPCPLLETLPAGSFLLKKLSNNTDIRSDCPKYRVCQDGEWSETENIHHLWRDDLVTFLIGCSFTFEQALLNAQIPIRHIEQNSNVPMYITNIPCQSAGPFHARMVVSMRPIPHDKIHQVHKVTSQYPSVHGAPIHTGNPTEIGISSLSCPDFGDPVPILPHEQPVFWACGVTPQIAIQQLKPTLAITHSPGYMLVTDKKNTDFQQHTPQN